ncbi:MAG: methyltransferase domain-containing protein [Prevotella sp.]|nr:methyltransferase domain-containing protein [Prevotella sp.]
MSDRKNIQEETDSYVPKEQWQFNKEVTDVFPNMLSRSIPGYESMRELVYRMARNFVKKGTNVLDIGCSTGISSELLIKNFGPKCNFVLTDVSEPMIAKCREKYAKEIQEGYVNVKYSDLREKLPVKGCSLILSCLTIQFTPIEYRQFIFKNIYESLEPGGALVLVEKVMGNSDDIDQVLVKEYYDIKRENQYTEEQIKTKRKSLEGSLVPLTIKMNEQLLNISGFNKVDSFWRYLNFVALIAIKEK